METLGNAFPSNGGLAIRFYLKPTLQAVQLRQEAGTGGPAFKQT